VVAAGGSKYAALISRFGVSDLAGRLIQAGLRPARAVPAVGQDRP
jgi:hypothetical protein